MLHKLDEIIETFGMVHYKCVTSETVRERSNECGLAEPEYICSPVFKGVLSRFREYRVRSRHGFREGCIPKYRVATPTE